LRTKPVQADPNEVRTVAQTMEEGLYLGLAEQAKESPQ